MSNIKNNFNSKKFQHSASVSLILLSLFYSANLFASDSLQFFSAKADIEIAHDNSRESFSANFRYKSEDTLWISLTGTLGIEGARMLVTKDSTYVINKLEKSQYKFANTEANFILPLALNLDDWKMILFNKMYTVDTNTLILKTDDYNSYTYYCNQYTKCLMVSPEENIKKASFQHRDFKCIVSFNNFQKLLGNKKMAYSRVIDIQKDNENWMITIRFKNHIVNKPIKIPFYYTKYANEEN
jgi:plasmid maintenance system killer protein